MPENGRWDLIRHLKFNEIKSKKYCGAGSTTDGNMAHAHCMLDNYGYRYTLGTDNSCYPSTPRMVKPTHLSVKFVRITAVF